MQKLTEAQFNALKWLSERGGIGVIDNHGRMIAKGEVARGVLADTWLRLFTFNDLTSSGPHKVTITSVGREDMRIASTTTQLKVYDTPLGKPSKDY